MAHQTLAEERDSYHQKVKLMEETVGRRLQEAEQQLQAVSSQKDSLQEDVVELKEEMSQSKEQHEEDTTLLASMTEQLEQLRSDR